MNATIIDPLEKFEIELPDWLSTCLLTESDRHKEAEEENHLVCRAFNFAYQLHEGQYRKSGESYIAHPVAVAGLLRDLGSGSMMIAAGFLHDVVEDTEVTSEEIEAQFGGGVRQLVEGVTKLSQFNFSSKTERQAENFRRMFLAMARDFRVIVVKLADRLHNMRTLEHLSVEKQRRIALETREIFAPLANRLGIGRFKWELEDLCFKYLEPDAYQKIKVLVAQRRSDREKRLEEAVNLLRARLEEINIQILELKGRPKHLYSIYNKMQRKNKKFKEIYDLAALRIIVDTKDACYRALAVVHDAFKPIPGRFKDYIGLPKPNRYQSLHTTVIGLGGRPLEVQIRTMEMHQVAEYGIAAHWKYKETGSSNGQLTSSEEKFTWVRQLLDWQNDLKEVKDHEEYLDGVKNNLFGDDIYVFTPKGDVIALRRGATPVDFAYRIHTEVGHHMKGARINEEWSVLDRELHNGDRVEIITAKNSHPSLDWLNFAVTPSACNRIRQWFKRSHREENIARGRELLEKELGKTGFDALLKSEPMQTVTQRCNYHQVEDLLAGLGYGEVTLNQVVNRLRDVIKAEQEVNETEVELVADLGNVTNNRDHLNTINTNGNSKCPIAGVEGLLHYIAGCCKPVPGESIIGYVTRSSKGIAIHRQDCPNMENIQGERLVPVGWNRRHSNNGRGSTYTVDLEIKAMDRVGVMSDILTRLKDEKINVCNAGVKTKIGQPALISLSIDIQHREQLDRTLNKIKKMSDILNIRRIDHC